MDLSLSRIAELHERMAATTWCGGTSSSAVAYTNGCSKIVSPWFDRYKDSRQLHDERQLVVARPDIERRTVAACIGRAAVAVAAVGSRVDIRA